MVNCNLIVSTKQSYDDHTDSNKEEFTGTFAKKNKSIYIIYKEEDKCQGTKVTNQIKISKDGSVDVRRMGDHKSLLNFTKDKPYTTYYNTGYGSIELTFRPIEISYLDREDGYKLKLIYDIYMKEEKLSYNEYILEAKFKS